MDTLAKIAIGLAIGAVTGAVAYANKDRIKRSGCSVVNGIKDKFKKKAKQTSRIA